MSGRTRLALCAFAATMMTAGALLPLVETSTWLLRAAFLLAVQSGVGALARRMRLARILTVSLQTLATLLTLTVAFAREHALFGVLPGPQAVQRLAVLLTTGADDVGRYAIPAPATDGILLMLIGGVLLVGLAVDVLAVTFRAAAAAGLPLLALYSVAAGLSDGGAGWLWFVLAGCGYLLLLLAEGRDRLSRWGRVFGGASRAPGGPAAGPDGSGHALAPVRTGRRIGVVALGIALAVPAALPALDGGLLGGTGPGQGGGSGGGTISAVNPLVSLQNNLNQPENREVMTYRTNSASPEGFYLRILALDQFSGGEWRCLLYTWMSPSPRSGRTSRRRARTGRRICRSPTRRARSTSGGAGGTAVRARGAHPGRRRRPDHGRCAVRGQQPGGGADGRPARRVGRLASGPGP